MHKIQPHLPLTDSLTVGKSKIHGLGIIAKSDIENDICLGISHILNDRYEGGLIRTPLGGFLNHSDSPNTKYNIVGDDLNLVTIRKIMKGEEITVSYRGWYSDEILDAYR
jgi:SET domain